MTRTQPLLLCCFLLAGSLGLCSATPNHASPQPAAPQTSQPARPAEEVPVLNGAAGPCTLQLNVTTADGQPVYAAKVKVHIAYRFGGFHKLDLEASTNVNGKVKFVGLPSRVHRAPLEFQASQGELTGAATFDPALECDAKRDVILGKPQRPQAK